MLPFKRGEVFVDKYRIHRALARSGMGVVVRATQLGLDRPVALKFFTTDTGEGARTALARFEREARAAARLQSEHVAKVFDVGSADGRPYIVTEYLRGEDLQKYLARKHRLPADEAVAIVLQTCAAIAKAHAAGIVHRDLQEGPARGSDPLDVCSEDPGAPDRPCLTADCGAVLTGGCTQ